MSIKIQVQGRFAINKIPQFSLLTLSGAEWRERRTKLTPIFTPVKIKMMFNIIDSISDLLVKVVGSAVEISDSQDMRMWAQRFSADSIGNTIFGLECDCK